MRSLPARLLPLQFLVGFLFFLSTPAAQAQGREPRCAGRLVQWNSASAKTKGARPWGPHSTYRVSRQRISDQSGCVSFLAPDSGTEQLVGLALRDTGEPPSFISAVHFKRGGRLSIVLAGQRISPRWEYRKGDRFLIAVDSGQIEFRRNGRLFYAASQPSVSGAGLASVTKHPSSKLVARIASGDCRKWLLNGKCAGKKDPGTATPTPQPSPSSTATPTPAATHVTGTPRPIPTLTATTPPTSTHTPSPTATPASTATPTSPATPPAATPTPTPARTVTPDTSPTQGPMAFYVSTRGNDSANGSLAAPWRTIQRALSSAPAGSTILIRDGTYTQPLTAQRAGITLSSYPGERARITTPYSSGSGSTISIAPGADGVTLRNLDISGGYYYAVKLDTTFDNRTNPSGRGPANVLIDGCTVHDSGSHLIKISPESNYVTIRNSEIFNSGRNGKANGIDAVNANWLTVQNCYLHDMTGDALFAKGGSAYTLVERNLVERADSGILLGQDTASNWFNLTRNPNRYESMYGEARNNIIMQTRYSGLGSYSAIGPKFYNNTLLDVSQVGQAAIYFAQNMANVPGRGAQVTNNVVRVGATRRAVMITVNGLSDSPSASNNTYFFPGGAVYFEDDRSGFAGNLTQWKYQTGQDASSRETDPRTDPSGHLLAESPNIDQGRALTSFSDDFDGRPRPLGAAWDIGAVEY